MEHSELTKIRVELREEMRKMEDRINQRIAQALFENKARDEELRAMLQPISETYKVASTLGKWLMGAAVFISIVISILLGLKGLILRIFSK